MKKIINLNVNIILIILLVNSNHAKISDKRLCADENCSTVISVAKTNLRYNAPDKHLLSFSPNVEVKVYSKSAGSNKDLWGVDIQGRRGYVPHSLIREYRTYQRDLQYEVPTEFDPTLQATEPLPVVPVVTETPKEEVITSDEKKQIEEPTPTVQPFEVIDGTKVFLPPNTIKETEKAIPSLVDTIETPTPISAQAETVTSIPDKIIEELPTLENNKDVPIEIQTQAETVTSIPDKIIEELPTLENIKDVPIEIQTTPIPVVKEELNVPSLAEKQEDVPAIVENIPSESKEQKSEEIVNSSEDDYDENESDEQDDDDEEEEADDEEDDEEGDDNKESGGIFANLAKMVENAFTNEEVKSTETVEDSLSDLIPNDEKPIEEKPNSILEEIQSVKEEVPSLPLVPEMPVLLVEETKEEVIDPIVVLEPAEKVLEAEKPLINEEQKVEPIEELSEKIYVNKLPEVPIIPKPILVSVTEQEKLIDPIIELELKEVIEKNVTETEDAEPTLSSVTSHEKPVEPLTESVPTIDNPVEPIKEEKAAEILPTFEDIINKTEENLPEFKRLPEVPEITENILDPVPTIAPLNPNIIQQTTPEETKEYVPVVPNLVQEEQVIQQTIPEEVVINKIESVPVVELNSEEGYPNLVQEDQVIEPTTISPLEDQEIPFQINEELITIAPEIIIEETPKDILRNDEEIEAGIGSVVELHKNDTPAVIVEEEKIDEIVVVVENESGFFSGMFGKVKTMFGGSESATILEEGNTADMDSALHKILYPEQFLKTNEAVVEENIVIEAEHCEKLSPNACPKPSPHQQHSNQQSNGHHKQHHSHQETSQKISQFLGYQNDDFAQILMENITEMSDLILYLGISALTVLSFILGHYCIDKSRKERPLISKLNSLEKTLMVSSKECTILKSDLFETKHKLASIEDNSFGSNEMVIAIKRELENTKIDKISMNEQIITLEKELENAAEAGLELNKMVSELLNNQMGSDSIINSVEELQHQLNEQQNTISSINSVLAEKSRENSELQILLQDQKTIYESQLDEIQRDFDEINLIKQNLETDVLDEKKLLELKLKELTEEKSNQQVKFTKEMATIKAKLDESQKTIRNSKARVQALEECIKDSKNGSSGDFKDVMKVADIKSDLLAVSKEREQLKESLEGEMDARKLLEDHVKTVSEEVSSLRQEYNLAEKERLEAQTRLEVLSGYFKAKETQLQKELSVKEAMWMQSQGETTSTVERVRTMQDEIQTLKSQNDSLKVEIEAQSAAHKAQQNALETRAHEAWLTARQVERRFEESRSEASVLRRKLTSMAEIGNDHSLNGIDGSNVLNAPSPILMDNPSSPLIMGLPPPPFMAPPFMGHPPPHPFIPPPFMPNEMRPPPLGRLMSPPPNRYSPNLSDRDRYSPDRRYSPDNRDNRYNDSRYNDTLSPYETETDFSPPPSPPGPLRRGDYRGERERGGGGGGYNKAYSPPPPPTSLDNNRNNNKKKGISYSDAENDDW